jgi:transposase InsO family protein
LGQGSDPFPGGDDRQFPGQVAASLRHRRRAATHKRTKLVLDALQMAVWRRDRDGHPAGPGLVHYSDAGPQAQYTSFVFTAHLIESGSTLPSALSASPR